MTWNHRVMRTEGSEPFRIVEVYYDSDGSIFAWSEAHAPQGETPERLAEELAMHLAACAQPALTAADLP
jgi:translation elongation factor EF-Ts